MTSFVRDQSEQRVIAVETGGGTREELLQAEPDVVFADLANCNDFLAAIGK